MNFGELSSLADDHKTKSFVGTATLRNPSDQYADYGLIAFLGLAQRLLVRLLPITWEATMSHVGEGGQARIEQALGNIQANLAFKRFRHLEVNQFKEIAQEMVVLSHPMIRQHEHVVTLEGICWDFPREGDVRPVLVFEKSPLEDFAKFAGSELFRNLSIDERLNLCADIGVAVRDMHRNGTIPYLLMELADGTLEIIHGDLSPDNVLLFQGTSRITAKVADFGFATSLRGDDDLVHMPRKEPWLAPEHHDRYFSPKAAKAIDVYAFGMLCFWLLYEAGSTEPLQVPASFSLNSDQFVSFLQYNSKNNLLAMWKKDGGGDKLVKLTKSLIQQDGRLDQNQKRNLVRVMAFTLAFDSSSRCIDLERVIGFLAPERVFRPTEFSRMIPSSRVSDQEDFKISFSLDSFYNADFRLREIIVTSLESNIKEASDNPAQSIPFSNLALQLGLAYTIGFGVAKNDEHAMSILNQHSMEYQLLLEQIELINSHIGDSSWLGNLYPVLERQGYTPFIDFVQYYRKNRLLERARMAYDQEARSIQQVFGERHKLFVTLRLRFAELIELQGRSEDAIIILQQLMDIESQRVGIGSPHTLRVMSSLSHAYYDFGHLQKATDLHLQLLDLSTQNLGEEHHDTLTDASHLSFLYAQLGLLEEAEDLSQKVFEVRKRIYGTMHPSTWGAMTHLSVVYRDGGKWEEAERLSSEAVRVSQGFLSEEDPKRLTMIANLASAHRYLGRLKEAEMLEVHVMETRKIVLGDNHPDTLISMGNLASTYYQQHRLDRAEELELDMIQRTERYLGEDHPTTLTALANSALTLKRQKQWDKAERLELRMVDAQARKLGKKHPGTLISMNNLACTWKAQGRMKEALDLLGEALVSFRQVLGKDHPHTLNAHEMYTRWQSSNFIQRK